MVGDIEITKRKNVLDLGEEPLKMTSSGEETTEKTTTAVSWVLGNIKSIVFKDWIVLSVDL